MQGTIINIKDCFIRLLPLFLMWLTSSCSGSGGEVPDTPLTEDDGINVSIVLTGQPGEITRAENDEYGTLAENFINYKDLYVMTFSIPEGQDVLTNESELVEVMWQPSFATNGYKGESKVYSNGENVYLTARLTPNLKTEDGVVVYEKENNRYKNFCIVAIANIQNFLPSASPLSLVKGLTFSELKERLKLKFGPGSSSLQDWSWSPENTKGIGIPMFGVKRVNLSGYDSKIFSQSNPYELQSNGSKSLKMLRAFAKVIVELSEDIRKPNGVDMDVKFLSGGGIGKMYTGGFDVIPELSRMEKYYINDDENTGETGQIDRWYITDSFNFDSENNKNLQFNASSDGKFVSLYLPEYQFESSDADKPELTVLIAYGGIPQEFKFKFKKYPDNNETPLSNIYWNYLLRNYTYHFIVDVNYRVISVIPDNWDKVFDNEYNFGSLDETNQ